MDENTFLNQLKPEEIVDCFVLPHGLSKAEKAEADADLVKILNKKRTASNIHLNLKGELLQK